jgi:glyoxylase-like metal-dependent hydrolase (beta-lactamase superfamily II)
MPLEITIIGLSMPYKLGSVNCYLIKTSSGFILIDTGGSNKRADLLNELNRAGCTPGTLRLIILTHGDFDHIGNAVYLRATFDSKIAMQAGDIGMIEHGDMFMNRKKGYLLLRMMVRIFFRLGTSNKGTPDVLVDEGYDLTEWGFNAEILSLPGHTKGSIGILTADGDLFCGDLLENISKPSCGSLIDDGAEARESMEKLRKRQITMVYPGHGTPFPMSALSS